MEKKSSFFQMPLHYPRYSEEDYQTMPEDVLDRLLSEYGLPVQGDLAYKRKFAIGAFIWLHPKTSSHFQSSCLERNV
ncbi:hypothetical protein NMG60_11018468 [Bertholletia excelsa]